MSADAQVRAAATANCCRSTASNIATVRRRRGPNARPAIAVRCSAFRR